MAEQSVFRGYKAISEVAARVRPLAEWMQQHRPGATSITLRGADYDLVVRWPKAAAMLGFQVPEQGPPKFGGFTISRDRTPDRYERRASYSGNVQDTP